jgi:hypothetical protein
LETCARHQLDPFIKEVWAIRWKSGSATQTVVSKDGLVKIANRHTGKGWAGQSGEFLGVTSGVIHEHDFYDVERAEREDGTIRVIVQHKPRDAQGKPSFGGRDMKGRGEIVGSWGLARRRGHDDYFFECPRSEYDKNRNAWESNPHAMMSKVAEAVVLRKAFPIAGVLGEGEVDRSLNITSAGEAMEAATDEIAWPEDEQLSEELQTAFRALGYRRAKVRALVNACQEPDDYTALLARLNAEADRAAGGEDIPEAEVVG